MISRIVKVEVRVIIRRLRLITLNETLIILDITKTESNNVLLYIERKNMEVMFCFFTDGKQHELCEVDMITLGNHALQSYMT